MRLNFVAHSFLLSTLFAPLLASAQYVQSDFDEDGKSEVAIVKIRPNNNLEWNTKSSISGVTEFRGTLGKAGDHIIMGNWDGLSIGIIRENETTGNVTWRIKNKLEEVKSFDFGTNKDLFVSGADVDHDGVADAIVIEKSGKKHKWRIAPHPFASAGAGSISEVKFGRQKDTPFFMNFDGAGDWLGVVSQNVANPNNYVANLINPMTGAKKTINIGNASSRPLPLMDATGKDTLVFVKKKAKSVRLQFRNRKGRVSHNAIVPITGQNDGEVVVGDFSSEPGEEIAVQSSTNYVIFNLSTKNYSVLEALDGIPVDEININKFGSSNGGGGGGGGTEPGNCSTLNLPDGTDGNLWKPNSDTQYYAVFVAHSQFTGKIAQVRVYKASNNEFIKNLTYKGSGNGNRSNWQDYSLTGADYRNQYGAIRLRMDLESGGCYSAVISDPSVRVD